MDRNNYELYIIDIHTPVIEIRQDWNPVTVYLSLSQLPLLSHKLGFSRVQEHAIDFITNSTQYVDTF
jgi:hypothetical protein